MIKSGMLSGLLFCCLSLFAQSVKTPVDIHGALHVRGNQMVDKSGVAVQLRGISMSWSLWQGKKFYNPEVVDWLVKDFNISLLRVAMAVEPKGGYLSNPEDQLKLIIETVDQAISNGIYVIIDWHDHHAEKHLEESKAFFSRMSQKYSGVPNVIYEIFNEPVNQNWEVIKSYSIELIKTIRLFDSNSIIVVGSPRWDQEVGIAATNPIVGFSNLVYSFHFYASDPNHQEQLRAKAEFAMKAGLPIFVTEWGVGESNGNGKFDRDKTDIWLNWLELNKLSWAAWNVTDKAETTALLLPGAPLTGGWNAEQLTDCGKFLRGQLRKFNQ